MELRVVGVKALLEEEIEAILGDFLWLPLVLEVEVLEVVEMVVVDETVLWLIIFFFFF